MGFKNDNKIIIIINERAPHVVAVTIDPLDVDNANNPNGSVAHHFEGENTAAGSKFLQHLGRETRPLIIV